MRRIDLSHASGRRIACAVAAVLAAMASSGCLTGPLSEGNAAKPQLESKVFNISCEDGRRYAAKTLKARNYRITSVERSGSDTTIEGRNDAERVTSRLTVTCGADGVTVSPSGGGRWVTDGLRFGFYQIADMGDRIWPPPTGPVVKMVLYQGPGSEDRVSDRARAARSRRRLGAGGQRGRAHPERRSSAPARRSEKEANRRRRWRRRTRSAGLRPPIPTSSPSFCRPTKLTHGESVTGFVFFPTGAYTGGSLALIDDQTGEADDYDVNFEASA